MRRSLGIPDSALIVGGAGTLDWRKGPDLFVQVAGEVRRRAIDRPVHWIWVGGHADSQYAACMRHDAERAGVGGNVHVVGERRDPAPFFAAFDVFLSPSREDPFPLVNLEAAMSATPVICFDRAGGAAEFVEDDSGLVVAYLDTTAMAEAVVALLTSAEQRRRCGEAARRKVLARHDLPIAASQLTEVIERTIAAGPTPGRLARMARRAPIARTDGRGANVTEAPVDPTIALYRLASAHATAGRLESARALFEGIIAVTAETRLELAARAWFKLATLDASPDEAARCCSRALALCPTHGAARRLLDSLTASEARHG